MIQATFDVLIIYIFFKVESITNYLSLVVNGTINGIKVCIDFSSKCYQDTAILKFKGCNINEGLSIADGNNCSQFSIDRACASLYHIELETYTNTTYRWQLREILGKYYCSYLCVDLCKLCSKVCLLFYSCILKNCAHYSLVNYLLFSNYSR